MYVGMDLGECITWALIRYVFGVPGVEGVKETKTPVSRGWLFGGM
jgi:hypothetical protein